MSGSALCGAAGSAPSLAALVPTPIFDPLIVCRLLLVVELATHHFLDFPTVGTFAQGSARALSPAPTVATEYTTYLALRRHSSTKASALLCADAAGSRPLGT